MDLGERNLTDINQYLAFLEANNNLIRVKTEVDPKLEMAGIAKKLEGTKPILFERVKGSEYPVLIGLYWNRHILADILGTTNSQLPFVLQNEIKQWHLSPMEPVVLKQGPANEVIELDVDLTSLPIPHHAEGDGGSYLTSSVVIAKDPDTGVRNLSIHRMMVTGKNRLTLLLEELGHLMDYYKRAEAKGEALEITVNNGIDLPLTVAAAAPASAAPIDMDELGIASQMRGEPVELIEAQTVAVEAIANAQFVIEGRILPEVREIEGPYAEVTGYYAEQAPRWVFEATAITRRKNPIFHSILSGKEVRNAYGMSASAGAFTKINALVPEVTAIHFADGSVPYHLVVQIDKKHEGSQRNAMMAAFVALAFVKTVTVVDTDVDIYSSEDVDWAVATRCCYEKDLLVIPDAIGHRLNPMVEEDKWTRLGIDATVPLPRPDKFRRTTNVDVELSDYQIEGV
ncbi:UbiD family decarboxylase [Marinobacterium mangrovicola]|uniref:2,5-furandicarboxylate decarboxylase 1 n=1 Tax=Marinobacterium mangrovicola TaxID=1476959 RepID=A0A4R1G8M3_9GAMM|nr:UbiD family decarboxylase [Marinobacterium mangrovicola]TCK04204.1 2,5-furandicarboxylate decarboxylase 1 [Marinobacterium mangrovicola]